MQTSLRNLALVITLATQITVSLPSSFFPRVVKDKFDASDTTIGIIFAAYPLAQVLATPLWTFAGEKFSRSQRFVFGLLLSAAGVLLFAFSSSLEQFAASRFIQGVAAQGLLSCSIALIMQVSDNLQRDVGLEEFFVGVGYMIGPAMGGILYQYCGFEWAFIPLSIFYVLLVIPIPILFTDTQNAGTEDRGRYALLSPNDPNLPDMLEQLECAPAPGDEEETQQPQHQASWRDCLTIEVAILVLVAVVHAAAQSFKEVVLARHMHLGMSADAAVSGSVFTTEPVLYSLASFVAGGINRISRKTQICLGLLVYALGFFVLATPPFFVEPGSAAWGVPVSRSAEWGLTAAGLSLMGVGSALMLVPIVPAMLHCYASKHLPSAGEDVSAPEEIEDAISGIYSASWSLGELVGPPLGGFMLEHLPRTREINCKLAAADCSWGYFWSMAVFVVLLCIVPVVLGIALRGQELCHTVALRARVDDGEGQEQCTSDAVSTDET